MERFRYDIQILWFILLIAIGVPIYTYFNADTLFSDNLVRLQNTSRLIALLYILSLGTFIKKKSLWASGLGIIIIIIACLFKILHWSWANELILLGSAILIIQYSIHFIRKVEKGIIDYLKWVYVLFSFTLIPGRVLHYISGDTFWYAMLTYQILFVLLIVFVILDLRSNRPNLQ